MPTPLNKLAVRRHGSEENAVGIFIGPELSATTRKIIAINLGLLSVKVGSWLIKEQPKVWTEMSNEEFEDNFVVL